MSTSYFPVRMAQTINETDNFEKMLADHKAHGMVAEDTTEDDYIHYVFGPAFYTEEYNGKLSSLNDLILHDRRVNDMFIGMSDRELAKKGIERKTEWRDYLGTHAVIHRWSKYKQVYKIDGEFYDAISQTENVSIPEEVFTHMPVDDMYFDLSEANSIGNIQGVFVHIEKQLGYTLVVMYMVTDEMSSFSHYSMPLLGHGASLDFKKSNTVDTPFLVRDFRPNRDANPGEVAPALYAETDCRKDIVAAIFQLLAFITIGKEDISENPVTAKTYRPYTTVKNKFSEVQMWDVGVRYGKAIRIAREDAKRISAANTEASHESGTKEETEKEKRKSPIPHVRCAHWRRYHVGEGRKAIEIKWIPPTFVCAGKEVPVTIHEVKA